MRSYRTISASCCALACATLMLPAATAAHPDRDTRLAILDERTAADPCDAAAWLRRGAALRAYREWAAAGAAYDRAAACDPGSPAVILARGELAFETGAAAEAQALLDRYLAARPGEVRALRLRGRTLMVLGQPAAAALDFDRALTGTVRPEPDQYLERAGALRAAGRANEALAGLDAGLARLGPVPSLQQTALDIEVERGRWDSALQCVERAAREAPDRELWLVRRAAILEQAGRTDEARAAYETVLATIATRTPQRRTVPAVRSVEQRAQAAVDRLSRQEPDDGSGAVQ